MGISLYKDEYVIDFSNCASSRICKQKLINFFYLIEFNLFFKLTKLNNLPYSSKIKGHRKDAGLYYYAYMWDTYSKYWLILIDRYYWVTRYFIKLINKKLKPSTKDHFFCSNIF